MIKEGCGGVLVLVFADDIIWFSTTDLERRFSSFQSNFSSRSMMKSPDAIETKGDDDDDCASTGTSSDIFDCIEESEEEPDKLTNDKLSNIQKLLPIDVQFTIPGILIVILYCLASSSFYLFFYELLSFVFTIYPSMTAPLYNAALCLIGLILLRATGNIWYWTGECESGRLYKVLRIANRRRGLLVKEHKKNYNPPNHSVFHKRSLMLRTIQIDRKLQNFFHRRKLLMGIITTFGFNCIYMSVYYFQTEMLQSFVAESRVGYLEDLPSVHHYTNNNQNIESSLMYRNLSRKLVILDTSSRSTLKYQEPRCILSDDMNHFLILQDELYAEDSAYLYQRLSLSSYYTLLGDFSAQFVSKKKFLLFHGCVYVITAAALLAWFKWPLLDV